ncbi:Gas vesicle protein GvpA [Echinococcus multilocularis]|uniref:Gas vesicle protein GvpA n=1 Tax=Echinococcus multilocularis TaxID=6211 RepID=A0A068Y5X4_ECHMU|nr:Gas vesicle protein GvpA [Echinococcus multilocularis]
MGKRILIAGYITRATIAVMSPLSPLDPLGTEGLQQGARARSHTLSEPNTRICEYACMCICTDEYTLADMRTKMALDQEKEWGNALVIRGQNRRERGSFSPIPSNLGG